jgi:hypothetical protein
MGNNLKFMWNGIKIDGVLYRAWYSGGRLINSPEGTITIYARDYKSFPLIPGLTAEEEDRIRVIPDNPLYSEIKAAMELMNAHNAKRYAKSKYA